MPRHASLIAAALLLTVALPARADEPTPPSRIVGVVLDEAGTEVPGATLILTGDEPGRVASTRSDAEGRFAFQKVPLGEYELLAVYGKANSVYRGIRVGPDETVELKTTLPPDTEVISIQEDAPPPTPPKVKSSSVKKVLPWSDEAIDHPEWAVGWMLLDIDPKGEVAAFRWLHKPGHDLEAIAKTEVFKLRFEPAHNAAGQAVASQMLWKMEWPHYWWWNRKFTAPTPDFAPPVSHSVYYPTEARDPLQPAPRVTHRQNFYKPGSWGLELGRGGKTGFISTGYGEMPSPPCRGKAPLHMGAEIAIYRDCSVPNLTKALTEPAITR